MSHPSNRMTPQKPKTDKATEPQEAKGADPLSSQTHGAILPENQHITSVDQLLSKRRSVSKGSLTSFDTVASYHQFLDKLPPADLSRHAIEEARIVPISDRQRLIRRLEAEFVATASRTHGHPLNDVARAKAGQGVRYSPEQQRKMDDLKKKMGMI